MLKKLLTTLGTGLLGVSVITGAHAGGSTHAQGDIVDVAVAAGNFEILVTALEAAGLVETLKGDGPFTVFAPTDEAFASLAEDTLEKLLTDNYALTQVLTYHVVSGAVPATDVINLTEATTVQGQAVTIDISDGVKIGGSNVIATDILASNGLIHVIDAVLMPAQTYTTGDSVNHGFTGREQSTWR